MLMSNRTLVLCTQVFVYKQIAGLENVGLHDCLGKVKLVISNRTLVLSTKVCVYMQIASQGIFRLQGNSEHSWAQHTSAKPTQAKPSKAKPSTAKHSSKSHAFLVLKTMGLGQSDEKAWLSPPWHGKLQANMQTPSVVHIPWLTPPP